MKMLPNRSPKGVTASSEVCLHNSRVMRSLDVSFYSSLNLNMLHASLPYLDSWVWATNPRLSVRRDVLWRRSPRGKHHSFRQLLYAQSLLPSSKPSRV